MKPLQASEISYIIQAKIEGKTVQEILNPVDPLQSVMNDIQRLYEQALQDEAPSFSYACNGQTFVIYTQTITDLKKFHPGLDAIREAALAVTYTPDDGPF